MLAQQPSNNEQHSPQSKSNNNNNRPLTPTNSNDGLNTSQSQQYINMPRTTQTPGKKILSLFYFNLTFYFS
jgi:hypothetical protein